MKGNKELERHDIAIDREMELDYDIGQEITVYIETWFDVDEKFGLHLRDEDDAWLNMYGKYNPFADTLRIECKISRDDFSDEFDYQPTAAESQLIKDMITQKIREEYGQTPKEFCDSLTAHDEKVYVYQNRADLTAEQIIAKHKRIQAHCEECGYLQDGSISISVPMSRCGSEFKAMIDYCNSRGISKILVDGLHDIGNNPVEVDKMVGTLCGQGFEVEAADCGLTFSAKTENEEQGDGRNVNDTVSISAELESHGKSVAVEFA